MTHHTNLIRDRRGMLFGAGLVYSRGTNNVIGVWYMDENHKKHRVDEEKLVCLKSFTGNAVTPDMTVWSYKENALTFKVRMNVLGKPMEEIFYVHEEKDLRHIAIKTFSEKAGVGVRPLISFLKKTDGGFYSTRIR